MCLLQLLCTLMLSAHQFSSLTLSVVCVQYIEALCIIVNTNCSPAHTQTVQWPGYETAQIEEVYNLF